LGGLVLALSAAACQPRTEMMIGIVTDIRAPDVLDNVQLTVFRTVDDFPEEQLPPWTITGLRDQPYNLPGSYGVYSPDGSEIKLRVELAGFKGNSQIVDRTAVVSLVNGKTLFLRMGLVAGCMNRVDCGPTQTCVEGVCKEREVDSTVLPDFSSDLVGTLTCNSGTNFVNTEDGSRMPLSVDAANCPNSQCVEGTCLKPPQMNGGNRDGGVFADGGGSTGNDAGVMGGGDFGTTGTSCPGDSLMGPGNAIFPGTALSGIATDAQGNLYMTDSSLNAIIRTDSCGVGMTALFQSETGAKSPVVAGGSVAWLSGNNIRIGSITGGAAQTVATTAGTNGFLASDGNNLYYTDASKVYSVKPAPAQTPTAIISTVTPGGVGINQLGVGGGQIAWYNANTNVDRGSSAGPSGQVVGSFSVSRGLFVDQSGGVFFTDYAQGVRFTPIGSVNPMTLQPSSMFSNTPARITSDGTNLYVTTFTGTNDKVFELTKAGASLTPVAVGATFASSTVQPALIANPNGVYWIDSTNQVRHAPRAY
jgi:hypothetical protein